MQNLVPDLKICQEAQGIVKDSKFYWGMEVYEDFKIYSKEDAFCLVEEKFYFPAPLTDEILKVLPWMISPEGTPQYLTIEKVEEEYTAGYGRLGKFNLYYFRDKKLSNALLLLAIRLKKENIL
jgi:hypothetical protein